MIELTQLFPSFATPTGHLAEGLFQFFLDFLHGRLATLLLVLGQGLEILGRQDFAVPQGCDGQPHGRLDDGHVPALGFLLQGTEVFFVQFLDAFLDHAPPVAIFVGLEGGRDSGAQIVDEMGHVGPERAAATGGQAECRWLVRFGEIVDVAPILGNRLGDRRGTQESIDDFESADAFRTGGEKIVAFAPHPDGETHRLDGPRLAVDLVGGFDLSGGTEGELGRIAGGVEGFGSERFCLRGHCCASILSMSSSLKPKWWPISWIRT